jgi:hypothetical protein
MCQVKKTADNIDEAAKELPDANLVRLKHHSLIHHICACSSNSNPCSHSETGRSMG